MQIVTLQAVFKRSTMIVNTAIILDTRRKKNDGKYPVKLRVTHQRKQKYYLTRYSFTEKEYEKVQGQKPRGDYKDCQMDLNAFEKRATDIIKDMSNFSFEAFEKKFLYTNNTTDVFSLFEKYIKSLSVEKRAGTAISYSNAMQSISQYVNRKTLSFESITPEWLKGYEQYMIMKGRSLTTIGIYLRALRIIINMAIEDGLLSKEAYPFGKRRYQIPAGRNVKKALTLDDIQKIFDYEPETAGEAKARDLFLFSYLCNGINMKDIARLKYSNIHDDRVTFVRAKTERTSKKNQKPIVAMLTPEAKAIVDKWGNKPVYPESLVFDLISLGLSPEQEVARIKQACKTINKYMKRIAKKLDIDTNISTYTARHSFSTVLKRSGAPIEFISESLGHHDLRTTESYLDSFEDDLKRQYASVLTNFNSKKSANGQ